MITCLLLDLIRPTERATDYESGNLGARSLFASSWTKNVYHIPSNIYVCTCVHVCMQDYIIYIYVCLYIHVYLHLCLYLIDRIVMEENMG